MKISTRPDRRPLFGRLLDLAVFFTAVAPTSAMAGGILLYEFRSADVEDTYRGIQPIDLVPNLSPQNLASVEIGKDFMKSHGYIKNDFDVQKWAAPEFLEAAAKELIEEKWKKVTGDKLPTAAQALSSTRRIG